MAEHNLTGIKGEKLAAEFLLQNGYTIMAANWRLGKDEIDIVAKKDDVLVVVEVKTRGGSFFGEPEEFVTRRKQRNIIKVTNAYMEEHDLDMEVRFDIIGVVMTGDNHHIHHLEDAFQAIA